ncbi:MAG: type I restriction enzyme S subunit [Halioglobus sp.]|jgi:type I restriction enzyme S subunit
MKWNKQEWEQVKLGDLFTISSGGTPSRKKSEYFGGTIPWVKTGDLKGKFVNTPSENITNQGLENSSAKLFPKDTVLLAMYGATIGACSIMTFQGATNQACAALLPSDNCNENYLYYFLEGNKTQIIRMGVGGAQPNISAGLIKKIKIPLPPLQSQKEIADLLDTADALRQKTQAQLDALDELAQSVFLEMFGDPVTNEKGWEVRTVKQLCTKVTDGTHHSPPLTENGFKYVTAKHVKKDGVIFNGKETFISEKHHREIYSRCSPEKGDILYIKDGATTGVAAINPFKEEISLLSSLALLKLNNDHCNSYYIVAWLNSEKTKEYLRYTYMSGAAITRFTLKKINSFKVPTPPLDLQNQFATIIENIEAQKASLKASLKESEDLFGCLLQEVFG